MDIIPPSKKYDKETNSLLMFISTQVVEIAQAREKIYQDLQTLAQKKDLDVEFVTDIQTKLAELERSAVVLHDIARRKIKKY